MSPGSDDPERRSPGPDPTRSKVGRLIEEYGLDGLGDELVESWTAEDERRSLRALAESFNHRLLRAAMENASAEHLQGEVENTYRLLTDDETSAGARTQAAATLERKGIDVDRLRRDFVSHQAVHTYLTRYRGVEHAEETTDDDAVESALQAILRLQSRLVAVVEKNLDALRGTGRLTLGSFEVLVDVRVYCDDCGKQYPIHELFDRRGCDCDSSAD